MAENSNISWTNHTFNPWIGCARISPACDGCYAAGQFGVDGRFGPARVQWGGPGRGEGTRSRTAESTWKQPRKWDREAARLKHPSYIGPGAGRPVFVFCSSLADVFDNAVPTEWRHDLFDLIHETPHLTWLLLTKRPGNIVKLFDRAYRPSGEAQSIGERAGNWPRNAAIGCTVVNQDEADRDLPKLLAAKAALTPAFAFLSMEPLLGPVDLRPWLAGDMGCESCDDGEGLSRNRCSYTDIPRDQQCPRNFAVHDYPEGPPDSNGVPTWIAERRLTLDWVITGGETEAGMHGARPANPAWFRSLRDQCAAAGVPFHFKQWGEWQPVADPPGNALGRNFSGGFVQRLGKDQDPCTLDGVRHDARPTVTR